MAKATVIQREKNVVASKPADQILREEALQARDMVERGYMKLAKCLYDIYYQNSFKGWDYDSFEDYVDAELQINYRKAMYLLEIYNKAIMLNLDMDRLEKIGWTKARELVRVVDQNNAEEWMGIAEESTVKELNFKVKVEKDRQEDRASVVDEAPSTTTITVRLGMAENAIIQQALEESAAMVNTDDLSLALANICSEWLELKGAVPAQISLEEWILFLERNYPRKLAIVGVADGEEMEIEDPEEEDVSDDLEDLL